MGRHHPIMREHVQGILLGLGEQRLGDAADSLPAYRVRREGVKRLGGLVAKASIASAAVVAGGALYGNAMDKSPTMQPYIERQDESADIGTELHPDPSRAVITIEAPKSDS